MALIRCLNKAGVNIKPFTPTGSEYNTYTAGTNFVVGHKYMYSYMDQANGPFGPTNGGTTLLSLDKDASGIGHGGVVIFEATASTVVTGTRQWSDFYEIDGDLTIQNA